MKKVYYLGHCCSGRSARYELLELVREEGNKLIFHIEGFDSELCKWRTITLKGYRDKKIDLDGNLINYIRFRSSKEDFKYHFIVEKEIEDDVIPESSFYITY
jgi:hypothetical protein